MTTTPPPASFDDLDDENENLALVEDTNQPARQNMLGLVDMSIEERPEGLGKRWREIPEDLKPALWEDLRAWVDWLIVEYEVSKQSIPACWYRHRPIVAELYAMRCAEEAAWASDGPQATAATNFHPNLYAMLQRLSNKAGKCLSAKKHVEEQGFGSLAANTLAYDEADWNDFMQSETQEQALPRDEKNSVFWRRVVDYVDRQGEGHQLVSETIEVAPKKSDAAPVMMPVKVLTSQQEAVLVSNTVQVPAMARSVWQRSTDQKSWEEFELSVENPAEGVEAVDEKIVEV